MKILIDADVCPVVDIDVILAFKNGIECIIFCDTSHIIEKENAKTIICSKGLDSTDFALLNRAEKNDIVVTQDYGLASMCLSKKAFALNQNGLFYTEENINSLLMSRYISKKSRLSGAKIKGPSKRKPEQNEKFKKALESLIIKAKSI